MLAVLAIALLASCRPTAGDHVVLEPKSGDPVTVTVEVVATPQARQLGLMYRDELGPNSGMLFLFPAAQPLSFWMRNTKIPLDILYLADDGRILNIHERTTPFSEKGLPSAGPSRIVLEVDGGFCAEHGIAAGDYVRLGDLGSRAVR